MKRFAPLCWHEEHFRAQLCLARNRGYSVEYANGMHQIRESIIEWCESEIFSN